MAKPVILAVDDDPAVLSAVARDLRREYAEEYRVLRAHSGEAALDALRRLKLRGEPVALLVVDQRMPGMSGVEFLREAIPLHPEARKVLLTAYADTDAAIAAINQVGIDHYLLKPWDPPEERLYPVLTDLLDAWRAAFLPPFEGLRVVGHRWSAESHRVKDFLARNLVPYRWLDAEEDETEASELLALADAAEAPLPVVFFSDGSHLVRPSTGEIAERIGLHTRANFDVYDLIVVGAGPAGLAAAVYGASEGLKTVLVEAEAPGGQAGMSSSIENYLGFPKGLSGTDLARRAVAQALRFGAEILAPVEATGVELEGDYRIVTLSSGARLASKALLVASGVAYRLLDVPGAERLYGAGVFYGAALTEATGTRGHDVFVAGGGNSAGQAALYLAGHALSVTLVVRGGSLRPTMSRYLIDQIEQTPRIRVRTRVDVAEVHGERAMEAITVRSVDDGACETLPARALFVFIGARPRTEWLGGLLERDGAGYLRTGPALTPRGRRPPGWPLPRDPFWLETSVPGILAAGDVRHRSIKRIASAVGEGAMAVQFVHQHLAEPVLSRPAPAGVGG